MLNKPDPSNRFGLDKKISNLRHNRRRNKALDFYRKLSLNSLIKGGDEVPDTSKEIDLDYFHLDDIKLRTGQKVQVVICRQMYQVYQATVCTTMDELVYIKFTRANINDSWEATDRGRILIEGVWENSHLVSNNYLLLTAYIVFRSATSCIASRVSSATRKISRRGSRSSRTSCSSSSSSKTTR